MPYGEVKLGRHVYQRSGEDATYWPREREGQIVITSTLSLAKQVSSKFAGVVARGVQRDLAKNHRRMMAVSYLQHLSKAIGTVVQAKETEWEYALPELDTEVASIAVGLDGTCMLISEDNSRQAITGTLALFDAEGKRLHRISVAATPKHEKPSFLTRLDREMDRIKNAPPRVRYLELAKSDEHNLRFLNPRTEVHLIDCYHAGGCLPAVTVAAFPRLEDKAQRQPWLRESCNRLKTESDIASALLEEIGDLSTIGLNATQREQLRATTYFYYHHHQMDYAGAREHYCSIGSDVAAAIRNMLIKNVYVTRECAGKRKMPPWRSASVL